MIGKTDTIVGISTKLCLTLCLIGVATGCSSERQVEKDPDAIEAALEEHKAMAAREAAESGAS